VAETHPRGKGIWIKRIMDCEQGDLETIVARARQAGFSHVILKIADGADPEHIDLNTGFDYAAELIARLTEAGIEAWSWHHIYGDTPVFKGILRAEYHLSEAERALQRTAQLQSAGLKGFIIKADEHYERIPERARKASQFSAIVRAGLGPLPIGLSSWKYPNSHRRFPWAEFRNHCDFDMPQVFWIGRQREAARQLETSLQRFARLEPALPIVATGPAFRQKKWQPLPDQLRAFLEKAIELGLPAANFWNWDSLSLTGDESDTQPDFREHWNVIAEFEWPEPAPDWTRHPEPVAVSTKAPEATLELESLAQLSNVQPEVAFQFEDESEPARPFHSDAELETAPEPEPDLSLELDVEDELPEWLQGLDEAEAVPNELVSALEFDTEFEPARPFRSDSELEAAPEPEPDLSLELDIEDELPEWLQDLDEAFESEAESEPARPFRSDAELEAAPEPEPEFLTLELEIEEELPEWLQGLEEPAQSSPEEFDLNRNGQIIYHHTSFRTEAG
jgi:hypothetical protein